jgi:serine/threonine-protein kinase HipA
MPSKPEELYVWFWLPGAVDPIVAGRLFKYGAAIGFEYGDSYLANESAISIYTPELPLDASEHIPLGMDIHGCIADASPDSWGRRVIDREVGGRKTLDELDYLARSGSDRIGALDFQAKSSRYSPRLAKHATLDELAEATARIDEDKELNEELMSVLLYGSAVGGARPKALVDDGSRKLIAKFSSSTDAYPIVKAEFVAMQLATHCGINAAVTELTSAMDKDVLLVERFDRTPGGGRKSMVSALTILGLPDTAQLDGSYSLLALKMGELFSDHRAQKRELFSRVAFSILCSNTDDHLRNHAAFWDGRMLDLTPAYDICPYPRSGEATLATAIDGDYRLCNLAGLVARAAHFDLNESEAREKVDHQIETISKKWDDVCDEAQLASSARDQLRARHFLHDAVFYDY